MYRLCSSRSGPGGSPRARRGPRRRPRVPTESPELPDGDGDGHDVAQDCDDTDPAVHPGADEIPYDGVDNDCDPTTADDDLDGDGVLELADCDDQDPAVHPGAEEICNDIDDDCDGSIDEDATDGSTWYPDGDGDGFGRIDEPTEACDPPSGAVAAGGDCDDSNPAIHPGADEECNGRDDDCDGLEDEDFADFDDDRLADCIDDCPVFADSDAAPGGDGTYGLPLPTIGEAIDALADDCLQVRLFAGTFAENVDYGTLDLDLASLDGASTTIIEPPSGGSVVTITGAQTPAAALTGVTLRGGTGSAGIGELDPSVDHGGGLFVYDSDPMISGCIIEDNAVTGFGAGGALFQDDGMFTTTTIADNVATLGSDGGAGGLSLTDCDGAFSSLQLIGAGS